MSFKDTEQKTLALTELSSNKVCSFGSNGRPAFPSPAHVTSILETVRVEEEVNAPGANLTSRTHKKEEGRHPPCQRFGAYQNFCRLLIPNKDRHHETCYKAEELSCETH